MPNAPTHDFITLVTAAGADAAYMLYVPQHDWKLAALFTGTYIFAGYACAGDLDLKSTEYRRWGPLRFLWLPYQWIVPHRSWVSHGLILGGVLRVVYLALICTLLFWGGLWLYGYVGLRPVDAGAITQEQWRSLLYFVHTHPYPSIAAFGGFVLAGTTHSIADAVSTWFKRRF
jgi:uncharacterized metal-binding protein